LHNGADITIEDEDGFTPLDRAKMKGFSEFENDLLQK